MKSTRRRILEYVVDETMLKVGSEYIWLWVAIEPESKQIPALSVLKERNMFVTERYLSALVKVYKNIQYLQTARLNILWRVSFSNSITIFIHLWRKD